ncbi:MAG: rubredoxin [Proteobacteria bacterium]|nr:rubredoxin [Pseudomonadota bacterium]
MNAPVYRKWQCIACGEIFDEALGSPADGIPPGTRLEDLPDDWLCPNCGALKASFILMED